MIYMVGVENSNPNAKEKEEQIENLMGITEKDDRIDHLGRANESKTKIPKNERGSQATGG